MCDDFREATATQLEGIHQQLLRVINASFTEALTKIVREHERSLEGRFQQRQLSKESRRDLRRHRTLEANLQRHAQEANLRLSTESPVFASSASPARLESPVFAGSARSQCRSKTSPAKPRVARISIGCNPTQSPTETTTSIATEPPTGQKESADPSAMQLPSCLTPQPENFEFTPRPPPAEEMIDKLLLSGKVAATSGVNSRGVPTKAASGEHRGTGGASDFDGVVCDRMASPPLDATIECEKSPKSKDAGSDAESRIAASGDANSDEESDESAWEEMHFHVDARTMTATTRNRLSKQVSRQQSRKTEISATPSEQVTYQLLPNWSRYQASIDRTDTEDESTDSGMSTHLPMWSDQDEQSKKAPTKQFTRRFQEWDVVWIRRGSQALQQIIMSPVSVQRLCWDGIGVCLIMYDAIVIPLQLFSLPETPGTTAMIWVCMAFWTLDIFASLVTGQHIDDDVEMRPVQIWKNYARTWLPFDVVALAPDWMALLLRDQRSDSGSSFARMSKVLKALRVLRSLRLLRLVKLAHTVQGLQARVNSGNSQAILNFVKLLIYIFMINHYLACGFFGVNTLEGSNGWVIQNDVADSRSDYMYLTSLHWSITQFHGSMEVYPTTTGERGYAICSLFIGLICASLFVSSITNEMTKQQKLNFESFKNKQALMRYLHDNAISTELTVRIKCFIRRMQLDRMDDEDVKLIKILPKRIVLELQLEIKHGALEMFSVFKHVIKRSKQLQLRLCTEVISIRNLQQGEMVFSTNEECQRMYIVKKGRLVYTVQKKSGRVTFIATDLDDFLKHANPTKENTMETGARLAEPCLWTRWSHKGDAMSGSRAEVYVVDARQLGILATCDPKCGPEIAAYMTKYAVRFVNMMNAQGPNVVDDRIHTPVGGMTTFKTVSSNWMS